MWARLASRLRRKQQPKMPGVGQDDVVRKYARFCAKREIEFGVAEIQFAFHSHCPEPNAAMSYTRGGYRICAEPEKNVGVQGAVGRPTRLTGGVRPEFILFCHRSHLAGVDGSEQSFFRGRECSAREFAFGQRKQRRPRLSRQCGVHENKPQKRHEETQWGRIFHEEMVMPCVYFSAEMLTTDPAELARR
jgi:hypothetical protein